jgi:iron complex transport system permease protein
MTTAVHRARYAGGPARKAAWVLLVGTPLLVMVAIIAAAHGPANIPYAVSGAVVANRLGLDLGIPYTPSEQRILELIRLPRVAAAVLVGAALAVAGAITQAVFRNPLADPGVIGISSGAAVGAVAAIALGLPAVSPLWLPLGAFAGALLAAAVASSLAASRAGSSVASLVLAGVAVSSFLGAVTSAILSFTRDRDLLREMLFWLMGGLDNRTWEHVQLAAWPIILVGLVLLSFGRDLNVMSLGDESARSLGVAVGRARVMLLGGAALIAAVAVSISGTIAFVGLMVPHIMRLLLGPDHRVLLPASALGGATFLVLADTVARLVVQPAELRVGIVTAFLGAPFFLFLLHQERRATAR